ncbi:tRNA uracil 4-sulfurtransferase ThiI [Marinobacter sp. X15-166B]|uniref:tRNA uracil 4-sulfurtransferase ThiI n=1 Tax=Marinobacter sp. X15-166B TaxID=1897620 RepID=UPI00085C0CAD|nr:tRNA uracil 4-sulfurtransferase ThiI [Marinobacter sp. X15-166B]OEY65790.1 tRNA 4-thiouridine(8) synthase ThiI [Marinobacter sp. X15-166B]
MKLLIRPAAEVAIKSKPVRRTQMRHLRQNIRKLLLQIDAGVVVEGTWDRVDVTVPDEPGLAGAVVDALMRIPGISNIQEIASFAFSSMDDIAAKTQAAFAAELAGKTFVVRARRQGNHDFRSIDLERHVGAVLLANSDARGVDLSKPEVTVRLDIDGNQCHLARRRYPGLGGYPLGSVEPVMTLISGGYDSSVAAYLMLRRGLRNHFLFFNLGGTAHEVGVRQVVHYLWERYGASHNAKFISVPFDGVVAEIMRSVNHRHWAVVLKREMLRAAAIVAEKNNVQALVKGDAVGQVSSQTLTNINVVDRACDLVVFRPLIAMDKGQIIDIATEIGTEAFARTMPEYCGVISQRPATRAKLTRVEADEAQMDASVLEQAIAEREECQVRDLLETISTPEDIELVQTPSVGDVIIDVRHPFEAERAPLVLTSNEVLQIPFYELGQHLQNLPTDGQYLLYCDRGTMSQLHAGHLKAQGYAHIRVYTPPR